MIIGIVGFSLWASFSKIGVPVSKVGEVIQIQSVTLNNDTNTIEIYVQNVGTENATLATVFINGYLVENAAFNPIDLPVGHISKITLPATYLGVQPKLRVKVVTADGTFNEMVKIFG